MWTGISTACDQTLPAKTYRKRKVAVRIVARLYECLFLLFLVYFQCKLPVYNLRRKLPLALFARYQITYISDPFSYRIGVVFIRLCMNPIRSAPTIRYNSAPHQQVV